MYYDPFTRTSREVAGPNSIPLFVQDLPFGPSTALIPGTSFQIAYDSTSLDALKTCARKYELTILNGWVPKSTSIKLTFGIYVHRILESYHKLRALNLSHKEAFESIVYLSLLLGETLPVTRDNTRTKESLTRVAVWYLDQYANDPARTLIFPSGKPAVEVSFKLPFIQIEGVQLYLCGHIDRIVEYQDDLYFVDYKSTSNQLNAQYFAQFNPSNQMSLYAIASQVILGRPAKGGIIDAIQLGVNFCRPYRHLLTIDAETMEEDLEDLKNWITAAARSAAAGIWAKNNSSCMKWGGCEFQSICSLPPRHRPMYLKGNFHQRLWDPLLAR